MILLFKAWNVSRRLKTALVLHENTENLLNTFIETANQKLGIEATKVVLEQCGTEIDDDEVLKVVSQQALILLQEGEEWSEPINKTVEHSNNEQNVNPEQASTVNAVELGLYIINLKIKKFHFYYN